MFFDRHTVVFTHFSGDGHVLDHEMTTDPNIVTQCAMAFEDAWKIAIAHHDYTPSSRIKVSTTPVKQARQALGTRVARDPHRCQPDRASPRCRL